MMIDPTHISGPAAAFGATTIMSLSVAAVASVRAWVTPRRQAKIEDKTADQLSADSDQIRAEIKKMADETNRSRDYRIWQLEGYIDLDRTWHRKMIELVETLIDLLRAELAKTDRKPPKLDIPIPPEIPPPPPNA